MAANTEKYTFANLISEIRYEKLQHSYDIVLKTVQIVEDIITDESWKTAQDLIVIIKDQLNIITKTLPFATIPTNIIRHILKLIRELYNSIRNAEKQQHTHRINDLQQSLHHLVTAGDNINYTLELTSLSSTLKDHLAEYKVELETAASNIADQATEHIDSDEVILTIGKSNLVMKFLKNAAKTRKFRVIVVENAPDYQQGQTMAKELAASKIHTTVVSDSAVFAIMSRVNKVIIGVHSIMANGGLRASSGVQCVALAARELSVPVMVLSHLYKLTPQYVCSHEQEAFNNVASPAHVLSYSSGKVLDEAHVYNPVFDYVPPELVTLFITHQGGNATSYVYRLLSELYHPDDYDL